LVVELIIVQGLTSKIRINSAPTKEDLQGFSMIEALYREIYYTIPQIRRSQNLIRLYAGRRTVEALRSQFPAGQKAEPNAMMLLLRLSTNAVHLGSRYSATHLIG